MAGLAHWGLGMQKIVRQLVLTALLAGLVLAWPNTPTAEATEIYPGNPGNLQVTFDNTGAPGFNTGPAAIGDGAFRMDTGSGSGASAGGKVFLHSNELDGASVTALESFSFQYFIDPTSPASPTPYANLRVSNPLFGGARTLTGASAPPPGTVGSFTTLTVPDDDWTFTGAPVTCSGNPVPVGGFTLAQLNTICPGTTIVATALGALGGISVVTGVSDGSGWAGWTGVIDDVRINDSQYDLEPAQVTITPASPVTLPSGDPQTVTFTLQASGWNSFPGTDTSGQVPRLIVGGYEIQVGFRALGATTVEGLAGVVPVATAVSELSSPPPPITFTLDVTADMIGSLTTIPVDWVAPGAQVAGVAENATTVPPTTLLQLPGAAPAAPVPADPSFTG